MGFTIPVWLRHVISMLPAVIIVSLGLDPTQTLVISQLALVTAFFCAAIILFLNLILIYQTLGETLPL
ncbi:hypothetical protein MHB77_30195 [Paenibacillus sp. FSL K6-3166]|uniref:hypothetical protein n=1 Tax=Paenibacillus sp. FSL K6-3166 TaxID=2921492 RepID=UPI0030F7A342